jgi:hypothetical protein
MFLGWSSTKLLFFVPVGYSIWLPRPIICSDWPKFQRSSSLKLMNWLNSTAEKSDFVHQNLHGQRQFEHDTEKICFSNLFLALFIFLYQYPVKKRWPSLITDRDEMSNLYRGCSIDASYQVLVHLAKRFQRRFFSNRSIRNKNCLWQPLQTNYVQILNVPYKSPKLQFLFLINFVDNQTLWLIKLTYIAT